MALSQLLFFCLLGFAFACHAPDEAVSAKDRQLIRSSWEKASKIGDVAPQILLRLFQRNPSLQQQFASFASVPRDELLQNGNFLSQAYTIMAGLNVVIQSSGSQELLAQQAAHLGASHGSRGVTEAELDQMAFAVVDVLEEQIGLTAEAKRAWENGLNALNQGIAKNLKAAEDVTDPRTGLSPRQIAAARASWEKVRDNRNKFVSGALHTVLKDQPSLQKKFPKFANVALDSLPADSEFQKQVAKIADRLDHVISDLNEPLKLKGEQLYLSFSHKSRGVGVSEFKTIMRAMGRGMSAAGVSSDELAAWKQIGRVMGAAMDAIQCSDPSTGLSSGQIAAARASWAKIRDSRNEIIADSLQTVLRQNPSVQKKFTKFANVPVNSLNSDAEFQKQVSLVADRLDAIVSDLDDPIRLSGQQSYLAEFHKSRGIGRREFTLIMQAMGRAMSRAGVTGDELATWKQVGQLMGNAMDRMQSAALAPSQIATARTSWEKIRGNRFKLISDSLESVLKDQPSLQKKFPKFADVPLGSLASDNEFQKQVTLIADRLDSVVRDLDNPEQLLKQQNFLSEFHKSRGVSRKEFALIMQVMGRLMASAGVSADELAAWKSVGQLMGEAMDRIQNL